MAVQDPRVCRFCLVSEDDEGDAGAAGESEDPFVNPCPCRGSTKFVHLECLVQHCMARGEVHNFRCPTCKHSYEGRALKKLAEISVKKMEQEFGKQSPEAAHSLAYLAQAEDQLGNTKAAMQLLLNSLAISEAHFGCGHIATAASLAELARCHGKLGNALKQKELLDRSLEIKVRHYGDGHINTAVTLNNLATAHSELGNFQQEKELIEQSLAIRERHYGKGHIQTTTALVNLAGVYSELGNVQRCRELLEWSLSIEERHFGVGHLETAITLNNLALACGEFGDPHRMRELLLKSLAIKENRFGSEHQELCLMLANLAVACQALGDNDAAAAYCARSLCACGEQLREDVLLAEPPLPSSRRRGMVLLRAGAVKLAMCEFSDAQCLVQRPVATLQDAVGFAASTTVLEMECTRMSRIWDGVKQAYVVENLRELVSNCSPTASSWDTLYSSSSDGSPASFATQEFVV